MAHTHERGKAFGKGAVGHFSTAWADKTGKLPGWIGNTLEVHAFFAHEHQFRRYLDSWDTLTKNAWFIAMFVIHYTRAQVPWPRNQLNLGIATYLGSFLKVICITLLLFTSTLHWRRNRFLLTTQNSLFSSTTPIFACGVFKQICNFFFPQGGASTVFEYNLWLSVWCGHSSTWLAETSTWEHVRAGLKFCNDVSCWLCQERLLIVYF